MSPPAAPSPDPRRTDPPPRPGPMLDNLLAFSRLLRQAGLPVTLEQTLSLARALEWIDLGNRLQVFHAARCLLVYRHEDLELFALLFDAFWRAAAGRGTGRPQPAPRAPRHDPEQRRPFTVVTYLAQRAGREDPEIDVTDRAGSVSAQEVLRRKDFSLMTPAELAAVRRLLAATPWRLAQRRSRRRVVHRRGNRLHLRRLLRAAARHGGVPVALARSRARIKPRPLVLLADISGSMEKHSRLLLELFWAMRHRLPRVECFVFGTRLSRVTRQLALRNIDRALEQAGQQVVDWAGGTRIGDSLGAFNRDWARRVLGRGAVVILASDGWEGGDPARLGREMRHLHRRCHRLVWLNPLAGRDGYRPLVAGMAAALPHIDDLLPIHNLVSLESLAERLASLPSRRSAAAATSGAARARRAARADFPTVKEGPDR